MTEHTDGTEQATPSDEPETTAVPTAAAAAPELAWSQDDDEPDEPVRHSWLSAWGIVAVIAACSVVIAGVTALVLWVSRSHDVPPATQSATTVTVAPTTPAPVTTVTVGSTTNDDDQPHAARAGCPVCRVGGPKAPATG